MINNPDLKYSFPAWYPQFQHDTVRATILNLPSNIIQYLENDAFVLPLEATTSTTSKDLYWSDGSLVEEDKDDEKLPTFPEFSKEIQKVLDEYGAVFVKCNWSSPLDAIWVVPTKTHKCQTLEEVYLLLKSSERILSDLNIIRNLRKNIEEIQPCLVLKEWKDINPCTEFRCFVIGNKLVAISQRDISQYHKYTESEEYEVRDDIQTFFEDRVQHKFQLNEYTLDVVRYKKGKVCIIDFGPLNKTTTDETLFTYEELIELSDQSSPEFRLIGEEVGIQPKMTTNLCVPQEINEFYQTPNNASSAIDIIQTEVQRQSLEDEETEQ